MRRQMFPWLPDFQKSNGHKVTGNVHYYFNFKHYKSIKNNTLFGLVFFIVEMYQLYFCLPDTE